MSIRTIIVALCISSAMLACGDGNDLPCGERSEKAGNLIEAALSQNLSCEVDADCATVDTGTACFGSCPSAVAKDGLAIVQEAVDQADKDYCTGYQSDGCTVLSPGCVALPVMCAGGTCILAGD